MVGVGDEQPAAIGVGQDLARERKDPVGTQVRPGRRRRPPHHSGGVELGDHVGHEAVELIKGQLAFVLADYVARGVDEHEGRPSAAGVLLPHLELLVVDDRVFQPVAAYGRAEVGDLFLVGEFGRVDSDNHQLTGVLLFQFPQLRKNMGAVDSTVGPEVEDDDLAPQFLHGDGAVGVGPFQPLGKFRGGDCAGVAASHGGLQW